MPHHYKKKQTGPIDRTKKQGPPPRGQKKPAQTPNVEKKGKKPFPDPPTKTKKSGHVGPDGTPLEDWMARDAAKRQERQPINLSQKSKKPGSGMIYPERKKSGFFMQMGSKEINTPSNFSKRSAMLMTGDPSGGLNPQSIKFLNSFANIDPESSLGQDTLEEQKENFEKAKAGYQPPIELVSKNTSGSPEAYASLGAGLAKLIKPKEGTEAYARQQERKANRLVERYKRSDVNPSDSGYKAAEENLDKLKNKKGTQTKVGKKLRNIKKKIFK
jgi:hypothetical protein